MSLTIHNAAGETVQLSASPLALGGEAVVYEVPKFSGVVVKMYHDTILQKRGKGLQEKIEAMCSDTHLAQFKQHTGLAWPRFSVYDPEGNWRGYAMRKSAGVRMNLLAHAMAYRQHFPKLQRPAIVAYLINLLETVRTLHASGVMVGDYNLANFLCDPRSQEVTLIDCDSWQLAASGKTYRCPVSVADMLPPELHGKELPKLNRKPEAEHFSLAILIFKTLMLGRHPYDVVGGAGPVENIRNGYFPYGLGGGGIPKGPWFNIWSHLPFKLKESLITTFKEGSQDLSQRATVEEWIELLKLYQRELSRGWHNAEIKPEKPKAKEYRGTQQDRISVPNTL